MMYYHEGNGMDDTTLARWITASLARLNETNAPPWHDATADSERTGHMIGNGYWSTGITVVYGYSGQDAYGWGAEVKYCDDGFCDDDADAGRVSTEGELRTRYYVRQGSAADALTVVIDVIKADAERLGIRWGVAGGTPPCLYYKGDGEDKGYPPPEGWRELLAAQSARIGWPSLYTSAERQP